MLLSGGQKSSNYNLTLFLGEGGEDRSQFFFSFFFCNACPGIKHVVDNFLNYFVQDCSLKRLAGLAF